MIDQKTLDEWKRLSAEAPDSMLMLDADDETMVLDHGVERFYAAAREAVPALLAEVEGLRAVLREVDEDLSEIMAPDEPIRRRLASALGTP